MRIGRRIVIIDRYGRWHAETNYSGVPKEQMCVCDYIAQWIIEAEDYEILTTIDNLVLNIVACYEIDLTITCKDCYKIEEDTVADIKTFVEDDGGLAMYDYWDD